MQPKIGSRIQTERLPRLLFSTVPVYDVAMAPKPTPAADQDAQDRAEYLAAVDEGLADAKAGRTVPYEKIRRLLLSWGSDKERTRPKCP